MYVIRCFGVMFLMMVVFNLFAAYGNPGTCTFTFVVMILLLFGIFIILLLISRQPQNRAGLMYATPGLPFVPAIAMMINVYLVLNLSVLTLARFTFWMIIGLIMYFKYGIKNSVLETSCAQRVATPPPPNPFERAAIPPAPAQPRPDRNIFEGDGLYGGHDQYNDPLLAWHVADLEPVQSTSRGYSTSGFMNVETRYDARTNSTTSHASSRPPWAYPDSTYDNWD